MMMMILNILVTISELLIMMMVNVAVIWVHIICVCFCCCKTSLFFSDPKNTVPDQQQNLNKDNEMETKPASFWVMYDPTVPGTRYCHVKHGCETWFPVYMGLL